VERFDSSALANSNNKQMKYFQQDDIFDAQFEQKKQRYYYKDKVVRAINKKKAVEAFRRHYKLILTADDITNNFNNRVR
jgi:hypothetical protein